MICNFCGDPAASPHTGCVYGPRTLACHACVVSFWAWTIRHTNGKARRGQKTALTFYESAALFRNEAERADRRARFDAAKEWVLADHAETFERLARH